MRTSLSDRPPVAMFRCAVCGGSGLAWQLCGCGLLVCASCADHDLVAVLGLCTPNEPTRPAVSDAVVEAVLEGCRA